MNNENTNKGGERPEENKMSETSEKIFDAMAASISQFHESPDQAWDMEEDRARQILPSVPVSKNLKQPKLNPNGTTGLQRLSKEATGAKSGQGQNQPGSS